MRMIFHHPFPVAPGGKSGSTVRPHRMLEAFKALGFEVEQVTGYAAERRVAIRRLVAEMERGRRFDFVYAESHTMPSALTEPHHLPTSPWLDFGFFAKLRQGGVPIGLFYRDIHWRFDRALSYRSATKHLAARKFHWFDWRNYTRLVDHLFLPSVAMAEHLPSPWPKERLSALPPGGVPAKVTSGKRTKADGLRLLYVGGVTPPLYDLSPMLSVLEALPAVELIICCRPEEWGAARSSYDLPSNVKVVHESGVALADLYAEADLFALLWAQYGYHSFAMPVKVMEAISYGLPMVTFAGSEAARFVVSEDAGWSVDGIDTAVSKLRELASDNSALGAARCKVMEVRDRHTWEARAAQVAATLTGLER